MTNPYTDRLNRLAGQLDVLAEEVARMRKLHTEWERAAKPPPGRRYSLRLKRKDKKRCQ